MGFKAIEDGTALVVLGGVYQELPLAEMDGSLFAEVSRGKYVRLKADGSASKVNLRLEKLEYDGPLFRDRFGRLAVADGDKFQRMIAQPTGVIEPLQLEDKSGE